MSVLSMSEVVSGLATQMLAASDPNTQMGMDLLRSTIKEREALVAEKRLELSDKVEIKMLKHVDACSKCKAKGEIVTDCQIGSIILSAVKAAMGQH